MIGKSRFDTPSQQRFRLPIRHGYRRPIRLAFDGQGLLKIAHNQPPTLVTKLSGQIEQFLHTIFPGRDQPVSAAGRVA